MSLECDMFNSIYEQVGPKCPFLQLIDNPTCMHENEAAHLMQQKLDMLLSKLQLANEREKQLPRQQQKLPKWQKLLKKG